jgi:hypothetical protein
MDFDISVSGDQVTIKPKSKVFFTNEEFQKMYDEYQKWREVALMFMQGHHENDKFAINKAAELCLLYELEGEDDEDLNLL